MVSHGVLSWISPGNREHLIGAVSKRLKPGGLVYLSYNVTTGWTAMVPVRALMRMLAVASPERTDVAVPGVLDFVDRLKQAGALFFRRHPALENRLADIRKQDPRYIAHEYLNQDWHPLMFADVAGEMLEAKCRYIGSATLAENIDTVSVPANVAPMLAETRDPYLRETLRDFGCAQGVPPRSVSQGHGADAGGRAAGAAGRLTLVGTGHADARGGDHVRHADRHGDRAAGGVPAAAGHAGRRAAQRSPGAQSADVRRPATGGTDAGIHVADRRRLCPPDAAGRRHLQRGTRRRGGSTWRSRGPTRTRADLPRLAAPAIGSAIGADILETLLVGELLAGKPADVGALATEIAGAAGA